MVNATVRELQRRNDAVWEALGETLEGMDAADLARRARIPVFGPLRRALLARGGMLPVFVGIMFDRHWAAHIEQLAKIRRAAGLPEAQYTTPTTGATR